MDMQAFNRAQDRWDSMEPPDIPCYIVLDKDVYFSLETGKITTFVPDEVGDLAIETDVTARDIERYPELKEYIDEDA